jgi:hypothetical protein
MERIMDSIKPLFTATVSATWGHNGHTAFGAPHSHATRGNVDVRSEIVSA